VGPYGVVALEALPKVPVERGHEVHGKLLFPSPT
jgi:hypothetical protein